MSDGPRFTRRAFFRTSAAAAAAGPWIVSASAWSAPAQSGGPASRPAPSGRLAMGCVGVGGRGTGNLKSFLEQADVQIVAVCDVDRSRREKARTIVETKYADEARSGAYRGCEAYNDFRDLVARDDIDAVVVCTPDHWHALVAIAAARSGKDIYCEKPLTLTVAEGRALCDAVHGHGRVLQTGSHERSRRNSRFACEMVQSGRIGALRSIRVNLPPDQGDCGTCPPMPVPEGFDYDTWLGPAPWAPYTEKRCHFNFRYIQDYSGGELTDRGAHILDLAQWTNGTQFTGPVEIEGRGTFPRDGLWNTSKDFHVEYRYANGVRMTVESGGDRGVRFEGDEGWIFLHIHSGDLEAEPASILKTPIGPNEVHVHESLNHYRDFLDSVKARSEPVAPVEAGHRSASLCHLSAIAVRLERPLRWDPERERFADDDEANGLLGRTMRAPWRL